MADSTAHGIKSVPNPSWGPWASYILSQTLSCQDFTIVTTFSSYEGVTKIAGRYTQTFDLGNIDPDSIQDVNHGDITFHPTDNQMDYIIVRRYKALNTSGLGHVRLDAGQTLSKEEFVEWTGNFLLDDEIYRSRLTKALKYAVTLCGGKHQGSEAP